MRALFPKDIAPPRILELEVGGRVDRTRRTQPVLPARDRHRSVRARQAARKAGPQGRLSQTIASTCHKCLCNRCRNCPAQWHVRHGLFSDSKHMAIKEMLYGTPLNGVPRLGPDHRPLTGRGWLLSPLPKRGRYPNKRPRQEAAGATIRKEFTTEIIRSRAKSVWTGFDRLRQSVALECRRRLDDETGKLSGEREAGVRRDRGRWPYRHDRSAARTLCHAARRACA